MKKIIIHDYAGHPFTLDLSKKISKKYKVFHLFFINDHGPKANFERSYERNLEIIGVGGKIKYNKGSFLNRFFNDIIYGLNIKKEIIKIKPDIIISANCPTFSQNFLINAAKKNNIKFIYWIQDFYSIAVENILSIKLPIISKPISFIFKYLDKKHLNKSDKIIIISKAFLKIINKWKIDSKKVLFIPNWGNLTSINKKKNEFQNFKTIYGIDNKKFTLVYTGTLALKHNPNLILDIAKKCKDIQIIIFGFGVGFENLKNYENLYENLKLFPLQPFNKFIEILGSADAFLAILNEEAGEFSVPSKILNYLCAAKPIILSAPKNNLAAEIINISKSGKVFDKNENKDIPEFINQLKNDLNLRQKLSINGRSYAEKNFNIEKISKQFEDIIENI